MGSGLLMAELPSKASWVPAVYGLGDGSFPLFSKTTTFVQKPTGMLITCFSSIGSQNVSHSTVKMHNKISLISRCPAFVNE